MGLYYAIFSTMRLSAVLCERKNGAAPSLDTEYFIMRLTGALLVLLSVVRTSVIYLSLSQNIVVKYHEIVLISIATFTFGKLTMAIVRGIRQRQAPSPLLAAIRRIGYAEVAVSILTLQRSMVVSFGEQSHHLLELDAITGCSVCILYLYWDSA